MRQSSEHLTIRHILKDFRTLSLSGCYYRRWSCDPEDGEKLFWWMMEQKTQQNTWGKVEAEKLTFRHIKKDFRTVFVSFVVGRLPIHLLWHMKASDAIVVLGGYFSAFDTEVSKFIVGNLFSMTIWIYRQLDIFLLNISIVIYCNVSTPTQNTCFFGCIEFAPR
jgi:hypothetical protein